MTDRKKTMLRPLIAATALAALAGIVPLAAAVYTDPASQPARHTHPRGLLFPGVVFGDPSDNFNRSGEISALVSKVNELFANEEPEERVLTVASLYGEAEERHISTAENEVDATIPVVVGTDRNQPPIQVFTGADTKSILTQLFSGILDVNDETFARRRNNQAMRAPLFPTSGGAHRSGSSSVLSDADFLATQTLRAQPDWLDQPPIRSNFDRSLPPIDEKKTTNNTEVLKLVLSMLNPYFYGALVLILVFSVAWSMRARLSQGSDQE